MSNEDRFSAQKGKQYNARCKKHNTEDLSTFSQVLLLYLEVRYDNSNLRT